MHNRIRSIYMNMLNRCNSQAPAFESYSKMGIKVCDEWLESYESFETWALSHGYADNLCIDRMDTRRGYSPDNCRWITRKENARNRTDTVFVEYRGKAVKLCELCEVHGVRYKVVYSRLRMGWDIERAISQPIRQRVSRPYGLSKKDRLPRHPLKIALPYVDAKTYQKL